MDFSGSGQNYENLGLNFMKVSSKLMFEICIKKDIKRTSL